MAAAAAIGLGMPSPVRLPGMHVLWIVAAAKTIHRRHQMGAS
jgi:hypothetical protein